MSLSKASGGVGPNFVSSVAGATPPGNEENTGVGGKAGPNDG
jgi:hypothetical protein